MSLDQFFGPETMAVIGASRKDGSVGKSILENLDESFKGELFAVNPNAEEILGYKSYGNIKEIPKQVDHAVVALPPKIANKAVKECVEEEVPAVTVVTAGYKEAGEEGKEREEQLKEIVEGSSTRLLGPNCLGIWDAFSGVDTLFLPSEKIGKPDEGSIALISQSGSVGSSILDLGAEKGIGFSRFVSYGNQSDVNEAEIIEWLGEDEETGAIAVYMEGAKDARQFYERVKQLSVDKPIVVIKAGKFQSGMEAASSHTGSLAGSYQVYNGAFKQAGIVEADTVEQLFDLSKILAYQETIDTGKIAVVTNGGGYGVLASDYIESEGLELAEFSEKTEEELECILPDFANITNPIDVIGDADSERYRKVLEAIDEEPEVGAVLALTLLQPAPMGPEIIEHLKEFKERSDKAVAGCMVGGEYTSRHMKELENAEFPVFPTPERAVNAIKGLMQYSKWKRKS
ncbi:MAG: CoA-binding protein [Candidatus Nanohaloarchaea archaeon]|nr:CoA-binding protein [Candidatus Nanohaloarchaea archaeon]